MKKYLSGDYVIPPLYFHFQYLFLSLIRYKARVINDVAAGLGFLHTMGIIHESLNPGHILVFSFNPFEQQCTKVSGFPLIRKMGSDDKAQLEIERKRPKPRCMLF
jgi:Protein tyrosine kinase.